MMLTLVVIKMPIPTKNHGLSRSILLNHRRDFVLPSLMNLIALSLAILLLWPANAIAAAPQDEYCLKGLAPALIAGHFSGPTDCRWTHVKKFQKSGVVRDGARTFTIYDYKYTLAPPCSECAVHGGHRIILMEAGRYIGQYKPDYINVTVRHNRMLLSPNDPWMSSPNDETDKLYKMPIVVHFTRDGPPSKVWAGGEDLELFR